MNTDAHRCTQMHTDRKKNIQTNTNIGRERREEEREEGRGKQRKTERRIGRKIWGEEEEEKKGEKERKTGI